MQLLALLQQRLGLLDYPCERAWSGGGKPVVVVGSNLRFEILGRVLARPLDERAGEDEGTLVVQVGGGSSFEGSVLLFEAGLFVEMSVTVGEGRGGGREKTTNSPRCSRGSRS